ncbi:hypothetical protein AVEN_178505-1 [Araneus ventricosus]|uniref:Uncharacterized protein n=1 Tax=Araneus ventricosus TaxID=182803 RepID=A0A4Y2CGW7_ARAVE|nr:hypothetical protein AVEN_178505-1 [Araneus ventricosus]
MRSESKQPSLPQSNPSQRRDVLSSVEDNSTPIITQFRYFNRVTLVLRWHSRTLKDNRCESSSTEAGVLAVNTVHGPPLPKEVRTIIGGG